MIPTVTTGVCFLVVRVLPSHSLNSGSHVSGSWISLGNTENELELKVSIRTACGNSEESNVRCVPTLQKFDIIM